MKHAAIVAALTLATAAAPSASLQQFDLVCSGTQETIVRSLLKDETLPHSTEYRIDLTQKRYCSDECEGTFVIDEIQPGFISFEHKSRDKINDKPEIMVQVDRVTGEWHTYVADNMLTIVTKGTCIPAPFKGFPVPKTKF